MAFAPETDYQLLLRLGDGNASDPFGEGVGALLDYYESEGKLPICPKEGVDEDDLLDDHEWTSHWYKCPLDLKERLEALSYEVHLPMQMIYLLAIRLVIAAHWEETAP